MAYGSIKRKFRKSADGQWKSGGRVHNIRVAVSRQARTKSGAYTATACMGSRSLARLGKKHVHCGLGTGRTPTAAERGALRDLISTMK